MPQRALRKTFIAIVASIIVLVTLGLVDVWSEESAAIENFAEDQAIVARSLAEQLERRLAEVRKDAFLIAEATASKRPPSMTVLSGYADMRLRTERQPRLTEPPPSSSFVLSVGVPERSVVDLVLPQASIMSTFASFDRPASQMLLLLAPGEATFRAVDGRRIMMAPLASAVRAGATSMKLEREQAAALGLSPRIAVAGLAAVDAGDLGRWAIATIVSAERLRDRERRARTRVVFGVLTAGGLVAAFGALAFRRQRRELELSRELAVAAVERDHEARLDQAGRAATLGTLAMGIAHEISTPASVIQGRAEQLAVRVASDERASSAVQAIGDQAARISQVVRGFLGLARGDARAAEPVDADALVDGALRLVEHRFTKARVHLSKDVADGLPRVRGDRRLLEHALTNLLLNACDACTAGGTVEATVRLEGSLLEFAVLDDGHGISPEHVAHVTEPFFTTKEAGKGAGLGLAIASEIVRAHRGTLRLAARAPRGTRAVMALPIAEPPTSAEETS